jgi:hypothetical protein
VAAAVVATDNRSWELGWTYEVVEEVMGRKYEGAEEALGRMYKALGREYEALGVWLEEATPRGDTFALGSWVASSRHHWMKPSGLRTR